MNISAAIVNTLIALFAIAPVIYIIFGISFLKQKLAAGINFFSLFLFSMALYTFGYYLEINSTNTDFAFFIRNFEFLGAAFVPTFCLLFIVQNTNLFKIKARLVAFFCAVSSAIWLLYVTNPVLGLFYKSIEFSIGRYGGVMLTEKNIGFYLLMLYYAVQLVFSGIILLKAVKTTKTKAAKRSYHFLFFTFQSCWITVVFVLAGFDEYVDPTPFTLMVIASLFVVNETINDMFDRNIIRWVKNYSAVKYPSFLVSSEGIVVRSNEAANQLFDNLHKSIKDTIPDLDDGEKKRKPVMLLTGNNTKWVDVKKTAFDMNGTLTNYLLVDVSDDKHAALMAELFFDAVEDFVFIVTNTGKIMFVNNEVKDRLGYTDEEIKQMCVFDFHPAVLHKEIKTAFKNALEKKETSCRFPLLAKNGKPIPVETRVWLGDWNSEPVIFCMSKDVSMFEEAEEKFEKSFYKNPAIMAITNADTGEYLDVNDAFIKKLGYSKAEVVGKTSASLNMFADNNQRSKANQLLLLNGEFSDINIDIRAKSGDIFNGLFYGSYITAGGSTNLLTVMIDITENHRKDNLLRIITSTTQDFLKSQDYMETIPKAFSLLGEAFHVDSVFLFKTALDGNGFINSVKSMAEWCSPNILVTPENPEWQDIADEKALDYLKPLIKKETLFTFVKDLEESDLKSAFTARGIKSIMALPVFVDDAFWGFMGVHQCRSERLCTLLEENILKVFTDSLSMAIQRYQSNEKIEFLSFHDHLTGLFNRRYYEQEVLRLDSERHYPLALIMADVNGLKLTNDAFGHNSGDLLLQRVAGILAGECRSQDMVARIGGDEFIILLPNTDEKQAAAVIDRINVAIATEHIGNLELSASLGFAVKTCSPENMNDIFKQAEDMMYRNKLSESSSVRSKTIDLILNSLFEKNDREMQHSHRVGNLCEKIAKSMCFSKDDINQMSIAGMMHDIGKIGISEEALNKPDTLQTAEMAEIRRHSEIGYRILGSVSEFSKIADYVLEHHEKPDGTGYPKGLKGDEISVQAKIIALADSYDAMTSSRTYRKVLSGKEAVREIKRCSGTQFDLDIAKVFVVKVLNEKW